MPLTIRNGIAGVGKRQLGRRMKNTGNKVNIEVKLLHHKKEILSVPRLASKFQRACDTDEDITNRKGMISMASMSRLL
jgi:hypothetical protein